MGRRGQRSWKQKQADKDRNTRRNKLKRSYQFYKKNWFLENNISKFVKKQKPVPDFIQKEAKFRVEYAKKKNEFLPKAVSNKGCYIACLAAPTDESFYFIHKRKKDHKITKQMKSEELAEISEPADWGTFGPPEKTNNCTDLVVYEPKMVHKNVNNIFNPFFKFCYHNKLAYQCQYANRNVNHQPEYKRHF